MMNESLLSGRGIAAVAVAAACWGFSVSGEGVGMTPPVTNKVKVAAVKAVFVQKNSTSEYKLDMSRVPEIYRKEIQFYTVNGLNYLQYKEAAKSPLVIRPELTVVDGNASQPRTRFSGAYKIEALENGQVIWSVGASCSGRLRKIEDINFWFPGLVAATLPYIGQNVVMPFQSIPKHPEYLTAVATPPAR